MARIGRRERMVALVEGWRRSGQSAAVFCRRRGIKPQRLSYWKRVLGIARPVVRRRSSRRRADRFVPVRLVGAGSTGALEIHLTSGDRVVIHEGSSRELLREALAVLRERC
jgi:hypothetical protein